MFRSVNDMRKHNHEHHPNSHFSCWDCGSVFETENELQIHRDKYHTQGRRTAGKRHTKRRCSRDKGPQDIHPHTAYPRKWLEQGIINYNWGPRLEGDFKLWLDARDGGNSYNNGDSGVARGYKEGPIPKSVDKCPRPPGNDWESDDGGDSGGGGANEGDYGGTNRGDYVGANQGDYGDYGGAYRGDYGGANQGDYGGAYRGDDFYDDVSDDDEETTDDDI